MPPAVTNSTPAVTNGTLWVDEVIPAGGIAGSDGGDAWTWVSSNPNPVSGAVAHQSSKGAGLHQHYFMDATRTLQVGSGDTLMASVYLDPGNLPSQIMLQWHDGSWEHRAYWGANIISYGNDSSASRRYMGALPPAGQWVRLEVPASVVNLAGSTLSGMAFSAVDGRATWDAAGKSSPSGNSTRHRQPTQPRTWSRHRQSIRPRTWSRHRQSIRQRMWSRRHRQIPEQTSPPLRRRRLEPTPCLV